MTDINNKIREIRERLSKTTSGDWRIEQNTEEKPRHERLIVADDPKDLDPWIIAEIVDGLENNEAKSNADFIAHSKSDIELLLGEVDRISKENWRYRKALEFYADEKEWHLHYTASAWKLIFNSSEHDGHGFEIAKKALETKEG